LHFEQNKSGKLPSNTTVVIDNWTHFNFQSQTFINVSVYQLMDIFISLREH